MEKRLQELRAEYERGLQQMARLDRQRQELQHALLRIGGAIQVLEELLAEERATARDAAAESHPAMRAVAG